MSERRRDIAVGLTVLVALAMLAGMIVIFTGVPSVLQSGYVLKIRFPETHDAKSGDPVRLSGVRVGSITQVEFTDGDPRKGVTFTAVIHRDQRIPGNVAAYVHSRGFVGSAYIELRPDGPERTDPETGKPMAFLPTDRATHLQGTTDVQGGVVPQEVLDAVSEMQTGFREMGQLASNLNRFLEGPETPSGSQPATTSAPIAGQQGAAKMFLATVEKLGRSLDELHAVLGDKESQEHFKQALANLADASAKATEAMEEMRSFAEEARVAVRGAAETSTSARRGIEEVSERLIENAEQVSRLLASVNRTMTRIEAGDGTLGKLLQDAKLYSHLADAAEQLNRLMVELRQLARTWQNSGVGIQWKK
jgi:phospholipid/cholesterol/gamma-HCH transport system substrate-binding protein